MADGLTLADHPFDPVHVACWRCHRRGRHWRTTLVALYGADAPLPNVLAFLAHDCPMRDAIGNEACGACFLDLVMRAQMRRRYSRPK